jgi:predicted negative regulator of RcsB-dependent stress response
VQITNCIRLLLAVAWLLVLTFTGARAAEEAKRPRVALVIGNSRYEASVGPLRNTGNDAKAMAKTLRALGFTVIEEHNVTRDELMAAVLKFRTKLRGAEVGLFYFAGHGISVAGANYLLPVRSGYSPGATDDAARRLLAETKLFNAEQAVAEMSNTGVACNLVILDACRTTPVARNPLARDATHSGGLVEMNPPAGSLIAFSTDAGHAASDGEGANGIYTAELITHLRTPGLTIEQVFKRTRAGVMERSGGVQIPAEYSRLVGDDIFLAGPASAAKPEDAIPKGEPIPLPTPAQISKLAASGDAERCIEALRRFTRKNGAGTVAAVPLATLLEQQKEILRDKKAAAPRAEAIVQSCDLILSALGDCLPSEHAQHAALTAKAHSRRGDALLLLGKAEDALAAFDAALALTPGDAYILCNRATALLALGRKDEARADFTKAATVAAKKSGARRLATEALAAMK